MGVQSSATMPDDGVRVSLLQVASPTDEDRSDRIERVEAAVRRERGERGPAVVVLPELWTTGFFHFSRYADEAEPIDGPTVTRLRSLAVDCGIWLFGGSIVERDPGGGLHNTTVCIAPDGALAGAYRKIHLFGYESDEATTLAAGTEPVVVDTPLGRVGMTTCYDLRFPELYRQLVDRGAETFVVVSAWPAARRAHWELFTRTRAVESLAHVVATNAAGEQAGTALAGTSVVVTPWGETLAIGGAAEEWVRTVVDADSAARARAEFPALADRRLGVERP